METSKTYLGWANELKVFMEIQRLIAEGERFERADDGLRNSRYRLESANYSFDLDNR